MKAKPSISDISRAIACGRYQEAIAELVAGGHDRQASERLVAVLLAVNTPTVPLQLPLPLAVLVDRARRAMEEPDWSFPVVADLLEQLQLERDGRTG